MDARRKGPPRNARFSAQGWPEPQGLSSPLVPAAALPGQPDPLLSHLRCLLPPLGPGRPTVLGWRAGQVPACVVPGLVPSHVPWRGRQHCPAGGPAVLRPRGRLSHLAPGLPLWCPCLHPGPAALHLGLRLHTPAAGAPAARPPGLPPVLRLRPAAPPAPRGPAPDGLHPGPEHHAVAGPGQGREGPLGRRALRRLRRRADVERHPAPALRPPAGHVHLLRGSVSHHPVGLPGPQAQDQLTKGPSTGPPGSACSPPARTWASQPDPSGETPSGAAASLPACQPPSAEAPVPLNS